jgi:inhibitor of cysteine peptidase
MRTLVFLLALCCPLLGSLAGAAESKPLIFKEQSDKTVVEAKVGQSFSVELVSNPTTGYDWHVANLDNGMLSLAKQEFRAPTTQLEGAPGVAVWRLTPLAVGSTRFQLAYYRVWEGPGTAIKLYTLELRIVPAE